MKKVLMAVLTLALLVCCVITVASADMYKPYLRVTNIGTLEIVDDEHSLSKEVVNNDSLVFNSATLVSLKNVSMTNKVAIYIDEQFRCELSKYQFGSNPDAYVFLFSEPAILKLENILVDGDTYKVKFTSKNEQFLAVNVSPVSQESGSYTQFTARIEGVSSVLDFNAIEESSITGCYNVGQEVPIVFGQSGTAIADNQLICFDVVATGSGLSLLNQLPADNYAIHLSLSPVKPIYETTFRYYSLTPLTAKFTVTSGTVKPAASVPATGDSTPVALYTALALCCLAVIAVLVIRRRHA